jgi:four helix bundle protein
MSGWKDFREIAAWPRARELKIRIDELDDSARSAPRNIAEGFGRSGNREFARFARIAKGSELEVLNHLIDAHDQGLITKEELSQYEAYVQSALAAVVGLIRHLERNSTWQPWNLGTLEPWNRSLRRLRQAPFPRHDLPDANLDRMHQRDLLFVRRDRADVLENIGSLDGQLVDHHLARLQFDMRLHRRSDGDEGAQGRWIHGYS